MKYHPPRLDHVDKEKYEIFNQVVRSTYVYHDMMLGTLLHHAGEGATVILVSDHGFQSGEYRLEFVRHGHAAPAFEHHHFGVFLASGPLIKENQEFKGASILDITPTILHQFGLPTGKDMDGPVLEQICKSYSPIAEIDSWDAADGDDARHTESQNTISAEHSESMLQTLVDLGYIDHSEQENAFSITQRELSINLARAHIDSGELIQAYRILYPLFEQWPDRTAIGSSLLNLALTLKDQAQARKIFQRVLQNKEQTIASASVTLLEGLEPLVSNPAFIKKEALKSGDLTKTLGDFWQPYFSNLEFSN